METTDLGVIRALHANCSTSSLLNWHDRSTLLVVIDLIVLFQERVRQAREPNLSVVQEIKVWGSPAPLKSLTVA